MKVLLFITGHRQLREYGYFQQFLAKCEKLNHICDIFIHCNNVSISPDIVQYFHQFPQTNKQLLITSRNPGYNNGQLTAFSDAHDMGIFKEYDYVIALNTDVFIVHDDVLIKTMEENLENDIVYFITKSFPNDPCFYDVDFTLVKPKLLTDNYMRDEIWNNRQWPEHFRHRKFNELGIKYKFIPRYWNDDYKPRRIDEHLGLWHEHDLEKVETYLQEHSM